MTDVLSSAVVALAVLLALFLTVLAIMSYRRSKNQALLAVVIAFALFTMKGIMTLTDLQLGWLGHETSEMVASIFDLAILLVLASPFLRR